MKIIDDVLPDPTAYMLRARRSNFRDVTLGPDTFKGIALAARGDVDCAAEACTGARVAISFFRASPAGQREPNYIHTDAMMGKFTGIYYMNPEPPIGDGTAFWERDGEGWRMTRLVEAKFNRLLIFDASLHHSRALFNNYGLGDSSRLIQAMFLR